MLRSPCFGECLDAVKRLQLLRKAFLVQSQRLDRRLVDYSRDWQAVIALEVYEGRSGKMALERRREQGQK